jgi:hypothetical protein
VDKPLWRRGFDTVEQAAAPHLERAVQSGGFAEAVVLLQHGSKGLRRRVDGVSRAAWHLLNLPAGTDVKRLRRQVASLDHEVRLLRQALEQRAGDPQSDRPHGRGEDPTSGTDSDDHADGRRAARTGGRGRPAAPRRGAQRAAGAQRDQAGDGSGAAS